MGIPQRSTARTAAYGAAVGAVVGTSWAMVAAALLVLDSRAGSVVTAVVIGGAALGSCTGGLTAIVDLRRETRRRRGNPQLSL